MWEEELCSNHVSIALKKNKYRASSLERVILWFVTTAIVFIIINFITI